MEAKHTAALTELTDAVSRAMRRAFSLGQICWQQADSDSYSPNKKADETTAKFEQLVDETRASLLFGAPAQASMQETVAERPQDCIKAKRGDDSCAMCDDGRTEYCLYAKDAAPVAAQPRRGWNICPKCKRQWASASKAFSDAHAAAQPQEERQAGSAGTPSARLAFLLDELAKRFPAEDKPFQSDPPEVRFLAAIDSVQAAPAVPDVQQLKKRLTGLKYMEIDNKPNADVHNNAIDACLWLLDNFVKHAAPSAPSVSSDAAAQMDIVREGARFWHWNCPNQLDGVMKVVKDEPTQSLIQCLHCGKSGYYPVGGVGRIRAAIAAQSKQGEKAE